MVNVLFVCLGNICRSAMAEAMFNQIIENAALTSKIGVDSAGTSSEEQGNPPHPGAQEEMAKHGLDYSQVHSRPVTQADFQWADLIIGMDNQNVADLKRMAPKQYQSKIHLCLNIVKGQRGRDIADPWYDHRFARTYAQLTLSLPKWLEYIKQTEIND